MPKEQEAVAADYAAPPAPKRKVWVLERNHGAIIGAVHQFYEAGTQVEGDLLATLRRAGAPLMEVEV